MDWRIVQAHADRVAVDLAPKLQLNVEQRDVLATLRLVDAINRQLLEVAGAAVEIGAAEHGLTQKSMADALDVPASTLRGLRASLDRG